eukprot:TRINITY_DN2464_c2_g1_i1.p1 TRINITY_DN2464_c2_g1~~TRINITY_DN2464_c2_g1_i1.p1  ORF type:complete len:387 (-),score=36.82 TRINITY_DN2464_c2_g1_i1:1615-2775(-)
MGGKHSKAHAILSAGSLVVLPDGQVRVYPHTATAAEVMEDFPGSFLSTACTRPKDFKQSVGLQKVLKPGKIFFLYPISENENARTVCKEEVEEEGAGKLGAYWLKDKSLLAALVQERLSPQRSISPQRKLGLRTSRRRELDMTTATGHAFPFEHSNSHASQTPHEERLVQLSRPSRHSPLPAYHLSAPLSDDDRHNSPLRASKATSVSAPGGMLSPVEHPPVGILYSPLRPVADCVWEDSDNSSPGSITDVPVSLQPNMQNISVRATRSTSCPDKRRLVSLSIDTKPEVMARRRSTSDVRGGSSSYSEELFEISETPQVLVRTRRLPAASTSPKWMPSLYPVGEADGRTQLEKNVVAAHRALGRRGSMESLRTVGGMDLDTGASEC